MTTPACAAIAPGNPGSPAPAAKAWFRGFCSNRICAAELERLEDEAPDELYPESAGRFDFRPWTRETGEGGGLGAFLAGRLFEKAAVHTSAALARFSPEMAKTMPGADRDPTYVSASISLIAHPVSPRVPAVHMNTRFLSTSVSWFGGGADLTPLIEEQRSQERRRRGAVPCGDAGRLRNRFDPEWYPRYKAECGRLFLSAAPQGAARHRRHLLRPAQLKGDFEGATSPSPRRSARRSSTSIPKIVRHRLDEPWTESDRAEQLMRRGRYVEFNLLYDRGTMFGFKQGGNIEGSMLSSMPPLVAWP